jgi:hypothetical protein
MTWKGCGRKQTWPNLRCYPSDLPEGTEAKHEKPVKTAGLWAEI